MVEFFNAHRDIIAQSIGFIAMGCMIVSYQSKKHKTIILLLIISTTFWSLHFLVLGSLTAFFVNILSVFRLIVYYFHDIGKKWASYKAIPWIFGIASTFASIFTWAGPSDILVVIAAILFTYANWQQNVRRLKYVSIPGAMLWLIYNVVNGSIAGVINEILVLISISIYLIRTREKAVDKLIN
jgi:hypothetical protein